MLSVLVEVEVIVWSAAGDNDISRSEAGASFSELLLLWVL